MQHAPFLFQKPGESALLRAIQDRIMQNFPTLLLLDGPCAAGKTTLAEQIAAQFGGTVAHTDFFYLPQQKRTTARMALPGGHIDQSRIEEQLLRPFSSQNTLTLQRFDCATQTLLTPMQVPSPELLILEGSYSLLPTFLPYADLTAWLTVEEPVQKSRLLAREGETGYLRFLEQWIPLEHAYLDTFHPDQSAQFFLGEAIHCQSQK